MDVADPELLRGAVVVDHLRVDELVADVLDHALLVTVYEKAALFWEVRAAIWGYSSCAAAGPCRSFSC